MKKFSLGQRVIAEYLGAGTVVEVMKLARGNPLCIAYMVRFDETPDVRYNMGENPTMVFPGSLRAFDKINKQGKQTKN